MRWSNLIDDLKTRDGLNNLTLEQTEAAIAILAVVMHADDRASILEVHEFETLVAELPRHEGKTSSKVQVERAIAQAKAAGGADKYKAIIDAAAVSITDPKARREVLRLAAAMAFADTQLVDAEVAVLSWLSAAFSIPTDEAATLYAAAR